MAALEFENKGVRDMITIAILQQFPVILEGLSRMLEDLGHKVVWRDNSFKNRSLADVMAVQLLIVGDEVDEIPVKRFLSEHPELTTGSPQVLLLTRGRKLSFRFMAELFREGVCGFLSLFVNQDELRRVLISVVKEKQPFIDPKLSEVSVEQVVRRMLESIPFSVDRTKLTPRETEILRKLAKGDSVPKVAEFFGLSIKTIEAHKFNLHRKLKIHNRAQLTLYAIKHGLIPARSPHIQKPE